MSCDTETLQLGAIGAAIRVTVTEDDVVVNLSAVTSKSLVFKKPDGTSTTQIAAFTTDGTDGKLEYVTVAGFLDKKGIWFVQADLVFPSGYDGPTAVGQFEVLPNNN